MDILGTLRRGRERVARGWVRNEFHNFVGYCARGAVLLDDDNLMTNNSGDTDAEKALMAGIIEGMSERVVTLFDSAVKLVYKHSEGDDMELSPGNHIAYWNNRVASSRSDVVAAFDRAIEIVERQRASLASAALAGAPASEEQLELL